MTLEGIDVSHWQSGLDLGRTGLDFAIMKATEGTSYVDSECNRFVSQAKNAGMRWGTYHFAHTGSVAEAEHYLASIGNYIGHSIMVLDWEADAVSRGPAAAKNWLDRVRAKTGIAPLIYMSQSVATAWDWSAVARDYGLWVARYNDEIGPTGAWKNPAMWQYTSSGRVSGYSGNVDLNTFYGDAAAWDAYATGQESEGDWFDMATKQDLIDAIQDWATSPAGRKAIAEATWNTDNVLTAPSDADPTNPYWTGRGWLGNLYRAALDDIQDPNA